MYELERIDDDISRIALAKPEGVPEPVDQPNNVFVLHGEAPALVNAGHPSQFDALSRALRELDLSVGVIERVVYTCWDIEVLGAAANMPNADHFVFSPDMTEPADYEAFVERERRSFRDTAAQIVEESDAYDRDDVEAVEAFVTTYLPPVPTNLRFIPIRSGHTVVAGSFEFEVLATPGPAEGHVALYDAARRTLFGGAFTSTGLPVRIEEVQAYLISLERLQELDVDALLLNEGKPVMQRGGWMLRRALRFLNNFMSNAPAVMHDAPTVVEFIERDLGHHLESLAELILQMRRYKAPMDELVRAKMIDAEGRGFARRYGVDVEDPREPLRKG